MFRTPRLGASPQIAEAAVNRIDAGDEHPPPALAVGEGRRRHDEHAHRQAVGGDHPLQCLLTAVEVLLDVGQGDVHDRGVEVDHEQAEAGRQQGQPLAVREADSHATTLGRPRRDVARATTGRGPGIMPRCRRPRPSLVSATRRSRWPGAGPGTARPDTWRLTAALFEAVAHDEHLAALAAGIPPDRLPALLFVASVQYVVARHPDDPLAAYYPVAEWRAGRRRPAGRAAPRLLRRPPRRAGGGLEQPPLPDERGRSLHAGRTGARRAAAPRPRARARAGRCRHRLRPGPLPGPLRLLARPPGRRRHGVRLLDERGTHRLPGRRRAAA